MLCMSVRLSERNGRLRRRARADADADAGGVVREPDRPKSSPVTTFGATNGGR